MPSQATILASRRYTTEAPSQHFVNRSKDGITDLYIGLMHKESGGWVLVSNVVQVRGRQNGLTEIWEFDTENVVRSISQGE